MHLCMDWRAVRFDWNRARSFLVAADEGSFSAAARALGLTQPTVGRQVAALEEELGVVLFERVHNQVQLTEAGVQLAEHVRGMGACAARLSLAATGQATALEGQVCITASEVTATYLLPRMVRDLRVVHPGIEVEIVSSNAVRDLRRREADIAIRNVAPREPSLVAQKITDRHGRLYATPEYVERLGHPQTLDDLSRADFFGFDHTDALRHYLEGFGLTLTARNFPIVTESHVVQWELTKQGAGIGIIMDAIGDREPRVQRVLADAPPIPAPVWLVSHQELRTSLRIRTVFDWLARALRDHAGPR